MGGTVDKSDGVVVRYMHLVRVAAPARCWVVRPPYRGWSGADSILARQDFAYGAEVRSTESDLMTDRDRFSNHDAGQGAAERARRASRRVEDLREQLARAERQQHAWSAGCEGERRVAEALRRAQWPALHDLPWPGRTRANIDHLAVSSTTVWLIDAKQWSGKVLVNRQGVLRQNGYRRDQQVAKVREAATALAAALGPSAPTVMPVLCLTEAGSDLPAEFVDAVVVVGLRHLTSILGAPPTDYEAMPALMDRLQRAARTLPTSPASPPPRGPAAVGATPLPSAPSPAPPRPTWGRSPGTPPLSQPSGARPSAGRRVAAWVTAIVLVIVVGPFLLALLVLLATSV